MTTRRAWMLPPLLLVLASLGACSDGNDGAEKETTPAEVLAAAKSSLDETSGVAVELATESLPAGVDGVVSATGIGIHPPAFEGEIKVSISGVTADVPVVALDDVVYAKLPFTLGWAEIDPDDYGAPDPADLLSTEGGISSWLTSAESVVEGDQVRDGEAVLTSYSGTLPGSAVTSVIPAADEASDFDVAFSIDDEGLLDSAEVTGPFYDGAEDVAYTITLDDYGTEKDIVRP